MANTYKNSFFQMVVKDDGTYVKLFPPKDGGHTLDPREVTQYLDGEAVIGYDITEISSAIEGLDSEPVLVKVSSTQALPADEKMYFQISSDRMTVVARFYPASSNSNGGLLDVVHIEKALEQRNVRACVRRDTIRNFLHHRQYCKTYILAKGLEPRHGEDARIDYNFEVERQAKPTLNDDGTVDFHHLDAINHVSKGDLLATLYPEDQGDKGEDVFGNPIVPRKVKHLALKYGKNIIESEDKTQIFSDIDGHVSLDGDRVSVSDVFEVLADVDSSTGDIDYEGNVNIKGNVRTGFTIKASGDVNVKGVVEGATIIAGGQVVVQRGIQGSNKGHIEAGDNVFAKFIENCEVKTKGGVVTEAIMHSTVAANGDVVVDGKKGLVTGGKVSSRSKISLKVGGSDMGTVTKLEVGADPEVVEKCYMLNKKIPDIQREIENNQKIVDMYSKKLAKGDKLSPEKMLALKQAKIEVDNKTKEFEESVKLIELYQEEISANSNGMVDVEGVLYPGVEVMIADVQLHIKTETRYCKLIRDGADIRVKAY
ncbi:MAG: FapA family protein [Lachnospiraceae bacterium]|nr:FapA family protein [Lachnospiraceae bacterium]